MSTFDEALAFTLRAEGGYVNNPLDRGGATYRGITQRTYDAFRTTAGLAKRPVDQMEDPELYAIYRDNYWTACNCDALDPPLAKAVFDMAVNSGPWNAKLTLQRAALVRADGVIGPTTLLAAKAMPDIVLRFLKARVEFIKEDITVRPSQVVFLGGWVSRLLDQAWKGGAV